MPPSAPNPLLEPGFRIPFAQVDASHVAPAVDELLADADQRLRDISEAAPSARTFANTMLPLDALTERLDLAMRIVGHLEAVCSSAAMRDAYNHAQPRVSEFTSNIYRCEALWAAVQSYAASAEGQQLSGHRRRFLDKTVAEFKRHGAALDGAAKQRLSAIDVELTRLTLRFSQNVLDATDAFELVVTDERQLRGLPGRAVEMARESARAKQQTGWRFTLQAPSYLPVLTYLDDSKLREQVYRGIVTRATAPPHDNRPLLGDILALRAEKAELLGYAHFADLVLEDRMAATAQSAQDFTRDMRTRTEAYFRREHDELLRFRQELEGADAPEIRPWDVAYYAQKQRQARYSFDEEALRPYFAFERVLDGLFEIAARLYGVRIEPWADAPSWHESVRAYKLTDETSGAWLAGFYVDPFAREAKLGGAWMDGLVTQARHGDGDDARQLGVLVANVTPPAGAGDAQLTHMEVQTLFHEFGHLMHHCLSSTELRSQAGTHVAWDFVELPSQLLENWCWEQEPLDLFARHADTAEPLAPELFDAMRRARTFRAATAQMRQLGMATADLLLHTSYSPERDGDPIRFARSVLQDYSATMLPDDYAQLASFDHLFGEAVGYAAGYYSYKWAEVLDADAFTPFAQAGTLDPALGRRLREEILARGDEEDPAVLYRRFMQRDPDPTALMVRLGLEAD